MKAELERILALPIDLGLSEPEIQEMSRQTIRPHWHSRGFRLRPLQAWSLISLMEIEGLFAPIDVGGGKTLISVKGCADMYHRKGHERCLLVVPSNVYQQTVRDISWLRERLHLWNMPFILLGGKPLKERLRLARGAARGCFVMTYSLLSRPGAEDTLEAIEPSFCMFDEVHEIKNRRAARTGRILKLLNRTKPKFACLSGTMTTKSLLDYQHLIWYALRQGAPLPRSQSDTIDLASVLDAKAPERPHPSVLSRVLPILEWAQDRADQLEIPREELANDFRGRRRAYQARLASTPGVVYGLGKDSIGVSLVLHNRQAGEGRDLSVLRGLLDAVEKDERTPNGDPIAHAILAVQWRAELSAGFYNLKEWPSLEWVEKHKKEDRPAEEILEHSQVWHDAHNEYLSALRKWLGRRSKKDLDTPMLVGKDMGLHGAQNVGHELYDLWKGARALDFPGRVERLSRAVRVSDYKLQQAKEIIESWGDEGGILWYHHKEIGLWAKEIMPQVVHCPAGDKGGDRIYASKGKIALATIQGHFQGKNLQFHKNNHFIEWPRTARVAQQAIGRTHRFGQEADQLVMTTSMTTDYDHELFAACLNDTCYIQQTTPGANMRLMSAAFDPAPKVMPSQVLIERGFTDVDVLSEEAQADLYSKFAD